jgi:hypothetical protein
MMQDQWEMRLQAAPLADLIHQQAKSAGLSASLRLIRHQGIREGYISMRFLIVSMAAAGLVIACASPARETTPATGVADASAEKKIC